MLHVMSAMFPPVVQQLGTTFTTRTCDERCRCMQNGSLSCEPINCDNKAFCGLEDDIFDCHCQEGYIGDGTKCRRKTSFIHLKFRVLNHASVIT